MFTKGVKGTNNWCKLKDVSLQTLRFYLGVWARYLSCIIIQLKIESSGWHLEDCSAVERGLQIRGSLARGWTRGVSKTWWRKVFHLSWWKMLHKWPNHGCDLPVIDMSSSEGKKAEKFWEYCPLFTITISVLLGVSFAASVPAAGLGGSPTLKNGRKKWHLWHITTSLLSVTSRMLLVLYFLGPWIKWRKNKSTEVDISWCQAVLLSLTWQCSKPCPWAWLLHKSCCSPLAGSNFHTTRPWNAFKGFSWGMDTLLHVTRGQIRCQIAYDQSYKWTNPP